MGVNGGRERWGDPGGSNRDYYAAYYRAKGKGGKAATRAFVEVFGRPPSQGGSAWHARQS